MLNRTDEESSEGIWHESQLAAERLVRDILEHSGLRTPPQSLFDPPIRNTRHANCRCTLEIGANVEFSAAQPDGSFGPYQRIGRTAEPVGIFDGSAVARDTVFRAVAGERISEGDLVAPDGPGRYVRAIGWNRPPVGVALTSAERPGEEFAFEMAEVDLANSRDLAAFCDEAERAIRETRSGIKSRREKIEATKPDPLAPPPAWIKPNDPR